MVPMVPMVVVGHPLRLAVARGRWCRWWWYGAYGADGGGGASPPARSCVREVVPVVVVWCIWCRWWWWGVTSGLRLREGGGGGGGGDGAGGRGGRGGARSPPP